MLVAAGILLFGANLLTQCASEQEPLPPTQAGEPCHQSYECRRPFHICSRNTGEEGYCTRPCQEDAECPLDMSCSYLFSEGGGTVRVCGYGSEPLRQRVGDRPDVLASMRDQRVSGEVVLARVSLATYIAAMNAPPSFAR